MGAVDRLRRCPHFFAAKKTFPHAICCASHATRYRHANATPLLLPCRNEHNFVPTTYGFQHCRETHQSIATHTCVPCREKSPVAYHLTHYVTNIKSRRVAQHVKHRPASADSERVMPPSIILSITAVGVVLSTYIRRAIFSALKYDGGIIINVRRTQYI